MKNITRTNKMVVIAMMAAIGLVLQYIPIPFPLFPFLKIDFSDIFVMLPTFIFGPVAGISTAVLRSGLHLLLTGFDLPNMVGDVAAMIASISFVLPIYYVLNPKKLSKSRGLSWKKQLLAYMAGTGFMTFIMSVANYWIITPLYLYFFHIDAQSFLGVKLSNYILYGVAPFNLLKGTLISLIFALLFMKLKPWLLSKVA